MERDEQHTETKRRRYHAAPAPAAEPSVREPFPQPSAETAFEAAPQKRRREPAAAVKAPAEVKPSRPSAPQPAAGAPAKAIPVQDPSMQAATKKASGQTPAQAVTGAAPTKPDRNSGADRPAAAKPSQRYKTEKSEPQVEIRTPESFDMRYSRRSQPVQKSADTNSRKPADDKPVEKQPAETAEHDTESKAAEKTKERPPLKKRLPYYIGIAVCSIVLIVSGTLLIRYYSQVWRANRASNQLRTLYTAPSATDAPKSANDPVPTAAITDDAPTATAAITAVTTPPAQQASIASANDHSAFLDAWPKRYPGNEGMVIQPRFEPLRHQNRDIVGWLNIEGVLDEPVFQRDNSYYLTHDANGNANPTGALFLDENCNLRTVPMMTLIHGHNMKEGAMFGSLKKYKVKDASFYRQHPFITFDTLYETATYVIFTVAEINIVPGNTHYFPFWHRFNFDSKQSFDSFVLLAKEYSRFRVDIDVQPGDRLLTLATCSSEDSNLRLIVMARMLREDEDKVMLSNKIYSAVAK